MTQKNNKPTGNKQKSLHRWHRWVGYISLALVVILSLTGLILNRTESWNLNQITVKNRLVNALYGLKPATPPVHFSAGGHWVSWLDGRLYLDSGLIAQNTARPIGISRRADLLIIAAEGPLALYFTARPLIETLDAAALPGRLLEAWSQARRAARRASISRCRSQPRSRAKRTRRSPSSSPAMTRAVTVRGRCTPSAASCRAAPQLRW